MAFSILPPNQLISWIKQYCANQNIRINTEAIFDLVAKNQDTFWLSQEIIKLKHYSNNNITKTDISKLTPTNPQDIIFDLTDEIGQRHPQKAYQIAKNLIQKGEEPFPILATVATHIQNLLIIKDLQNKKQTASEIKEKSSLHPYVIQKCEKQARNFDIKQLAHIYQLIAQADINLKNGQGNFEQEMFNIIFATSSS
jgi:DNA polymerase-3 subunit delta